MVGLLVRKPTVRVEAASSPFSPAHCCAVALATRLERLHVRTHLLRSGLAERVNLDG
jgi:hypothetical protein